MITVTELLTELRHKYITILKSIYWEAYEEGQCQASSVRVLIESADRALDHEERVLADWEFINSYIVSDGYYIDAITACSHLSCIGWFFKNLLFTHYKRAYDIIVTFVECHEQAIFIISSVIENKQFLNKIITESKTNTEAAEIF